MFFNPVQDGGKWRGAKSPPPYQFFPVTSTNVGINPKNVLTFLTLLPHWCKISGSSVVSVTNY